MSSMTHMVQITLDTRRLTRWSSDRRMDAGDMGYVSHALLCDAVGDLRPQPFVATEKMGRVKLLGYARATDTEMKAAVAETAEPEVAACILDIVSKPMPDSWSAGQRLRFSLRAAPTRQGHHPDGSRKEGDAILFEEPGADRYATYMKWLTARFGAAATLENCELMGFRTLKACRRAVLSGNGKRPAMSAMVPDASFEGTLRIGEPSAFSALLRGGVGRHKAFGFGALMLRPAKAA